MPFSSRSYVNRYTPSGRFPVGVKWLLIVNVSIFLLYETIQPFRPYFLTWLALAPLAVLRGFLWQILTYSFLHTDVMSVVWDMLALWMFGAPLERTWGRDKFLRFYFACGTIGGLAAIAAEYWFGNPAIIVVGSAGVVYGLLAGYAVVFPDNTLLFGFLIPMKSKYFVLIIGAIVFFQSFPASIGQTALLTGMLAGYLLLRGKNVRVRIRQPLFASYQEWKLRRAKKKFEVYLKKRNSGSDRWVN